LETKCSKCTEIQKGHIRKAAKFFIANRPEDWKNIMKAVDPDGVHAEGLKKFLQGS
jgi:hypothetical protein